MKRLALAVSLLAVAASASAQQNLTSGKHKFTSDILFNGAPDLGTSVAPAGTIYQQTADIATSATISGDLTMSGSGSDILANADNENDIGTEAARFAEGFFKTLDADTSINTDGTLDVVGVLTATGDAVYNGALDVTGALTTTGANTFGSTLDVTGALTATGAADFKGRVTVGTLFGGGGCPNLASAATVAPTEYCHVLTGTTNVTTLTTGSFTAGDILILEAAASVTIEHGNDIVLPGASNFAMTAGDAVTFLFSANSSKFTAIATSSND